jgi:hypothetical protein
MYTARISDLDELALSVRDLNSRIYILEAISAYKAGAFRSSIISTWVAVVYDIISKIRELASQGNKEAIEFANDLDKAIDDKNRNRLEIIEKSVLEKSVSPFGFISNNEIIDLQRLKDDRNMCAHPSFVTEGQLFQPSPELVRMHIAHAILHLLQHMPIQGKEALERFKKDLTQPSFPIEQDEIERFMRRRYSGYARSSLVEGMIDLILKIFIRRDVTPLVGKERIIIGVLTAISKSHPLLYDRQSEKTLNKIVVSLDDNQLLNTVGLISTDIRFWGWIGEDSRIRLINLARTISLEDIISGSGNQRVFYLLDLPELRSILLGVFEKMDIASQMLVISRFPRPEFVDKAIEIFSQAGSFKEAEALGERLIRPMIPFFSGEDVSRVVNVSRDNAQIWSAMRIKSVLIDIFDQTVSYFEITKVAWKEFIEYVLRSNLPDTYYGYPEIQQRLSERNIVFKAALAERLAEDDDEEEI